MIPHRVSIHDRPAEADGKRFGDWEMDPVVGAEQKSAVLTIIERSRNFFIQTKLPSKNLPMLRKLSFDYYCHTSSLYTTIQKKKVLGFLNKKKIFQPLGFCFFFWDPPCSEGEGGGLKKKKKKERYSKNTESLTLLPPNKKKKIKNNTTMRDRGKN